MAKSYLNTSFLIASLAVQAPIQEEAAVFAGPLFFESFGYENLAFGPTLDFLRIHRQL